MTGKRISQKQRTGIKAPKTEQTRCSGYFRRKYGRDYRSNIDSNNKSKIHAHIKNREKIVGIGYSYVQFILYIRSPVSQGPQWG